MAASSPIPAYFRGPMDKFCIGPPLPGLSNRADSGIAPHRPGTAARPTAVLLLLVQSLVMLAAGEITPGVRMAPSAALPGFCRHGASGALPALFLPRRSPNGWKMPC